MTNTLRVALFFFVSIALAHAAREPVLKQIDLPHNYYFREMYLPQVSSGPSSLSFSPDGQTVVYSMGGSLWRQAIDSEEATQLTAGAFYDHQPDWSRDGKTIVFTRYQNDAMELWRIDPEGHNARALTHNKAVNLEPRISPDGKRIAFVSTQNSGHFDLWLADIDDNGLHNARALSSGEQTAQARYYYSTFDHYLHPSWSADGQQVVFVNNHQISYGTGDLCRAAIATFSEKKCFWREETSWQARPEVGPDGVRVLYSSYHGRQHHQLWLTTLNGDAPLPLTFGDFDRTQARWSPDGQRIAYISNENGNTAIVIQDMVGGATNDLTLKQRHFATPQQQLNLTLQDQNGQPLAARVSVSDAWDRAYVPNNSWWHSDDSFDRAVQRFETAYFFCDGQCTLTVPQHSRYTVRVSGGLALQPQQRSITTTDEREQNVKVVMTPLNLPTIFGQFVSADLHVHGNYGGHYRQTLAQLAQQARAEHLDVIYNLVVNKEQRFPDMTTFSATPFTQSGVSIFQAQEYHTSFWGHLGLLHLNDHLLLPGFSAYQHSALSSPYPHNGVIADLTHAQQGLVGYVHPFDWFIDPEKEKKLSNQLPADVAHGKVDYYEVVGFSDHLATADVWHRLLNCGFKLSAGAGTDAMSNYASLRGPVGLNRVYLQSNDLLPASLHRAIKQGNSFASNFAQLGLLVDGQAPGQTVVADGAKSVRVNVALRAIDKARYIEIIYNGKVVKSLTAKAVNTLDQTFDLRIDRSGWLTLRAYDVAPQRAVLDLYPYAETSPIYIEVANAPLHSSDDATYFVRWLDRVIAATNARNDFNNETEKQQTLNYLNDARDIFRRKI